MPCLDAAMPHAPGSPGVRTLARAWHPAHHPRTRGHAPRPRCQSSL